MVSREHKRSAILHEKLQLLRSVTNSHAVSETSIILDASKYIEELKQKVERLSPDVISIPQTVNQRVSLPMVKVETLEKGYMINVYSGQNCPGLLVYILQVFEELGLSVLEARISCTDSFRLQAVGGENDDEGEIINSQVVKRAVLQACKNWRASDNEDEC